MTQVDLEREVSRATGESRGRIRRHGFSILPLGDQLREEEFPDAGPQLIDWDEQEAIHRRAA